MFEHQVLEDAQRHKGHILIRKQNCVGCHKILAMQITDKLGTHGEGYVVKDAMLSPFGIDFLYGKETWFGNPVKCPNCGMQGKLPMDKPLNAEEIARPKEEVKNVT